MGVSWSKENGRYTYTKVEATVGSQTIYSLVDKQASVLKKINLEYT